MSVFHVARSVAIETIWIRYVGTVMKKCGKRYSVRCVFHDDRSPSLTLYEGGGYKCYGCQAAGSDGISFLSRYLGVRPADAARRIIQDFGLEAPRRKSKKDIGELQRLYGLAGHLEENIKQTEARLFKLLRDIDGVKLTIQDEEKLDSPLVEAGFYLESKIERLLAGLESEDPEEQFLSLIKARELI